MACNQNNYEVLCGLAAAEQLSDSELLELESHLANCVSCSYFMAQMLETSRTVFLATVDRKSSGQTPSGMEQRFVERALSVGIPLTRKTSSSGALSVLQLALVACLAILSINAGWKIFSAHRAKENIGTSSTKNFSVWRPDESHARGAVKIPEIAQPAVGRTALKDVSAQSSHRQMPGAAVRAVSDRRNSTLGARSLAVSSKLYVFPTHTTEILSTPYSYLDSGLHLSSERPLRKVPILSPGNFSGAGYVEAHAFHYRPELASLSFLDYPQTPGATSRIRDLSASTPTFHLDLSRIR